VRAGSKVEIGVYEPSVCQVGNSDNRYGGAVLPVRAQRWVDDSYVAEDNGSYCYEIRIINRWGLGAAPFRQLVSREPPPPAAPFVRSIAEYPDESADYVVDAVVPEEADLHVDVTPTGECTTQYDETRWSIADSVGAGLWALYDVPVGPVCLSFYSVDWNGVASGAVTREVAHAPRPG
jgi:hypothetical protein